jgi:hypothetical protein
MSHTKTQTATTKQIIVEPRGTYQGVKQYGITGQNEITPSRKTAEKWAALENAAQQVNRRHTR